MKALIGISALAIILASIMSWRIGFDHGADVALCVAISFKQSNGKYLAKDSAACQQAKQKEGSPFWYFRRGGFF